MPARRNGKLRLDALQVYLPTDFLRVLDLYAEQMSAKGETWSRSEVASALLANLVSALGERVLERNHEQRTAEFLEAVHTLPASLLEEFDLFDRIPGTATDATHLGGYAPPTPAGSGGPLRATHGGKRLRRRLLALSPPPTREGGSGGRGSGAVPETPKAPEGALE